MLDDLYFELAAKDMLKPKEEREGPNDGVRIVAERIREVIRTNPSLSHPLLGPFYRFAEEETNMGKWRKKIIEEVGRFADELEHIDLLPEERRREIVIFCETASTEIRDDYKKSLRRTNPGYRNVA